MPQDTHRRQSPRSGQHKIALSKKGRQQGWRTHLHAGIGLVEQLQSPNQLRQLVAGTGDEKYSPTERRGDSRVQRLHCNADDRLRRGRHRAKRSAFKYRTKEETPAKKYPFLQAAESLRVAVLSTRCATPPTPNTLPALTLSSGSSARPISRYLNRTENKTKKKVAVLTNAARPSPCSTEPGRADRTSVLEKENSFKTKGKSSAECSSCPAQTRGCRAAECR